MMCQHKWLWLLAVIDDFLPPTFFILLTDALRWWCPCLSASSSSLTCFSADSYLSRISSSLAWCRARSRSVDSRSFSRAFRICQKQRSAITQNFLKNILRKQSKEPDDKRSTSFFRRSTTILVCVITRLMLSTLLIMVICRMLITYEPDMRLSNFIEFSLAH